MFTDKTILTSHERAHVSQKPHECVNCGKRFAHSFNLEIHTESYCTFQGKDRDPGDGTNTKEQRSAWQASPCLGNVGGRGRTHSVKVEVIDLGSDSEAEEAQSDDFLPLEVCLNEGEEELSIRDLMERYEDKECM